MHIKTLVSKDKKQWLQGILLEDSWNGDEFSFIPFGRTTLPIWCKLDYWDILEGNNYITGKVLVK